MLIAATDRVHGLTLVTRNVRDFEGCEIDWLNPFSRGAAVSPEPGRLRTSHGTRDPHAG